ncbi:MAG: HAMP domain-containing histidine kinase [Elusimicrobia bacterium]|nr:HAMP domain-containing histidine kinase [Elusimicrobiota bacterium]
MKTLELASKEILTFLARAFSQAQVYTPAHPVVRKSLSEALALLAEIFDGDAHEEIVFYLDHDRLLVNGRFVGNLKEQGSGIRNLFLGFNLHSVSFLKGIEFDELAGFCELFRENIKDKKEFHAENWLQERKIVHIRANEAFYVKMDKNEDIVVKETGAAAGGEGLGQGIGYGGLSGNGGQGMGAGSGQESGDGSPSLKAILSKLPGSKEPGGSGGPGQSGQGAGEDKEKIEVNEATRVLLGEIVRFENEIKRIYGILGRFFSGFATIDRDGRILSVDSVTEALFNRKQKDLSGQTLAEVIEPALHLLALSKELGTLPSQPVSLAATYRADEQLEHAMSASGSLIYNEDERIVGLLVSPPQETLLRQYNQLKKDMLATVIDTLSAPLETLSQHLARFDSGMSSRMDADHRELFKQIKIQQERLASSVKSLKTYSDIAAAQLKVFNVSYSVYTLIHDATEQTASWAQERKIRIETQLEKSLPLAQCDPKRSLEMLRHLIAIAIKSSPEGSIVTVWAQKGAQEHEGFIVFGIANAPGALKQSGLEKALDEFKKAQGVSDEQKFDLGLELVNALAQAQKGKFWITREEGRPRTACFRLPVFIAPPDYKPPEAKKETQVELTWWQKLLKLIGL